jgi:replication initiation protein RepC
MRIYLKQQTAALDSCVRDTALTPVDNNPKQPENWPHIIDTNQLLYLEDTVIADESRTHAADAATRPAIEFRSGKLHETKFHRGLPPGNGQADIRGSPSELTRLAARLRTYLRRTAPTRSEIIEAADWLRDEMGISQMSWGEACVTMGREAAAMTVAVVSTRPSVYF